MAPKDDLSLRRTAQAAPVDVERRRGERLGNRSVESVHRPSLDVIEAKLRPPTLRAGVIARPGTVSRLRRETATVASIVAPAGYGKTTLLAQWAAAESRSVAWVSTDERDNDPHVFLKHVSAAIDRIEPLDERLLNLLAARRPPESAPLAARAARALGSCRMPFLLVLDNADLLHGKEARAALAMLVARTPAGSTIALGSRTAPGLPLAALRATDSLAELGIHELTLSNRDAELLLQRANEDLSEQQIAELAELCEGWPAALYLAALSVRDTTRGTLDVRGASEHVGGEDRYVADYMRAEFLSQLRPADVRFLRRTSILEELSPPLCDAVLQIDASELELRKLARAQVILPLDDDRGSYRLHRLVREFLLRELTTHEPQIVQTLHSRAADWFETVGDPEAALEHANSAGDAGRVATIIAAIAIPASNRGHVRQIERSLARFGDTRQLERYPAVALHGSRIHTFRGRAAEAERWLDLAERGARRRGRDAAVLRPRISVVRAAMCRAGARKMLADAGAALVKLPQASHWYPLALHMRGTAAMLLDAVGESESLLGETVEAAHALGCAETEMVALGQLSLIARERGDLDRADELSAQAEALARASELDEYPTFAIALAACAQTSLRHGRWAEARELVATAQPLRTQLTDSLPWLAVHARLELARCCVRLRDRNLALALFDEADLILALRPRLGVLVERVASVGRDAVALPEAERVPTGLTPAELRLLPLLATHLSFREIADDLHVSRNTVKTQAISIYRKFGVSGRSEAIAAAGALHTTPDAA